MSRLAEPSEVLTTEPIVGVNEPINSPINEIECFIDRLTDEYSIRKTETLSLEKCPEEYLRERFYLANQSIGEPNGPADMEKIMAITETSNLMCTSDYSQWDFDTLPALDTHLCFKDNRGERRQGLSKNGDEVFGIGL